MQQHWPNEPGLTVCLIVWLIVPISKLTRWIAQFAGNSVVRRIVNLTTFLFSNSVQRPITLFCMLLLVVAQVSCAFPIQQSLSQPEDSRIFRMNLGTEPPSLDPAKVVDLTSFTVVQNVMRGLTTLSTEKNRPELDSEGNVAVLPSMALSWDISEDRQTYTFHLRENAQWSDGTPMISQHFVDAWHRVLTPETGADYAFFLFDIKGAKDFYDGQIPFEQVGILALNDNTLQVQLRRPIPFFLELCAAPVMLPFREDVYKKYGDQFTEANNSVTNGPYKLTAWQHNVGITLTPNPYYYAPPQGVDGIEMMMVNDPNTSVVMYENNELDFIETSTSIPAFDVRRLVKHPDARQFPIHRLNYIGFNVTQPPFNNEKVRQAFTLAIDRSYFPRLLKAGQLPNGSWLTPGLFGYNDQRGLQFNPHQAQQRLAEAGYPNGKGFPEVSLVYRTLYETQKEMEILQYLWKTHLNVNVRLENMEWKMFLKRLQTGAPGMYRLGWFVDYPDPDSFMSLFTGASGNNYTGWTHADYDQFVQNAAVMANGKKRQTLYDRAQRILLEDDAVIAPLYGSNKLILTKPWVKGLSINSLNLIQLESVAVSRNQR